MIPNRVYLTAILSTAMMVGMPSQATEYYNCANATGCKLIGERVPSSDYTQTQYPIVMTHGLTGWTKL